MKRKGSGMKRKRNEKEGEKEKRVKEMVLFPDSSDKLCNQRIHLDCRICPLA